MSEETVGRMARAMCHESEVEAWDSLKEGRRDYFCDLAQAAITAMHSKEVIEAAERIDSIEFNSVVFTKQPSFQQILSDAKTLASSILEGR